MIATLKHFPGHGDTGVDSHLGLPVVPHDRPRLDRTMGLLQATATNIISMVGVGPFLTIPFMLQAMNGPHILYAWIAGLILAIADGLVYAQLGAAISLEEALLFVLALICGVVIMVGFSNDGVFVSLAQDFVVRPLDDSG